MEGKDVGVWLSLADPGDEQSVALLLWRGDRPRLRATCLCLPHGSRMKFIADPPLADPDVAARKLAEIASTIEPVHDARIYIELINLPFLRAGGTPDEYRAGLK